jgi:hypothetical protein
MGRSSVKGDTFATVPNRGLITISIMLANIMQGVDNTILNVALPHIQSAGAPRARNGDFWYRDNPRANYGAGARRLVDL